MMSQYTARRKDPMIEDPDFEELQVPLEGLRMAALKGLEQGLATGQLDIHEVAMIATLLNNGKGMQLEEAIAKAHDMLQQQQAALAAQQPQPGAPTPGQMPGLAPAPSPGAAPPGQAGHRRWRRSWLACASRPRCPLPSNSSANPNPHR